MATHQGRAARLREFFAQDPQNQDIACDLADALSASGEIEEAKKILESFTETAMPSPGVRFRLARCQLATGAYDAAAAGYASLIEAGNDAVAVRHDLAFAQLCMREPQAAMATLESALAAFGPSPELLILKSRVNAMLGDYAQAALDADGALAMRPDDAQAMGVKSLALLDDSQLDAAAQAARDALERDPQQHEALLVASTISLWRQDLDPAQNFFERALARHPNSGRALSGYGQLLMLRNYLPQAGEVLEHAVVAMPDHIGTWHALAWNQLLRGDREGAEVSYRKAYDVDRNFGDTHGGLALVAVLRGDLDEAELSVRRALRLDPDAVTARYAQALLMEARGDADGSEAAIAKLLPDHGAFAALPVREFAQRLKSTLTAGPR